MYFSYSCNFSVSFKLFLNKKLKNKRAQKHFFFKGRVETAKLTEILQIWLKRTWKNQHTERKKFRIAKSVLNVKCGQIQIQLNSMNLKQFLGRWQDGSYPTHSRQPRTLTRLAVSEGADWPRAWLRIRTRLDVSAEADQACPATGVGRRYLPVGVKEKTM